MQQDHLVHQTPDGRRLASLYRLDWQPFVAFHLQCLSLVTFRQTQVYTSHFLHLDSRRQCLHRSRQVQGLPLALSSWIPTDHPGSTLRLILPQGQKYDQAATLSGVQEPHYSSHYSDGRRPLHPRIGTALASPQRSNSAQLPLSTTIKS